MLRATFPVISAPAIGGRDPKRCTGCEQASRSAKPGGGVTPLVVCPSLPSADEEKRKDSHQGKQTDKNAEGEVQWRAVPALFVHFTAATRAAPTLSFLTSSGHIGMVEPALLIGESAVLVV